MQALAVILTPPWVMKFGRYGCLLLVWKEMDWVPVKIKALKGVLLFDFKYCTDAKKL
jgi:hypothetical protein